MQPGLFQMLDQSPTRRRRPSLGHQKHEAVGRPSDRLRLETQFDRVIVALSDGLWHTQYEIAERLRIPQGSVGSQIRNARVEGYLIPKRRRECLGGTWEYRLDGKKVSA